METIHVDKDISVLCITAKSFPGGINDAYQAVRAHVPSSEKRRLFGISRPQNGRILYKAAAEELQEGEAEKLGCERFVIRHGSYIVLDVKNFAEDIERIGKAFQELLKHPNIDPNGYCLEWYVDEKDVRCMVPLKVDA